MNLFGIYVRKVELFILNLSLENFVNEIEKLDTIYIEQTAKELKRIVSLY